MRRRRIPLELLLGRQVRDCDGVKAGRIFEVMAEREGEGFVVREWHLGAGALGKRLGVRALHLLGIRYPEPALRVPWEQMDLSDLERPRLRCRRDELPRARD